MAGRGARSGARQVSRKQPTALLRAIYAPSTLSPQSAENLLHPTYPSTPSLARVRGSTTLLARASHLANCLWSRVTRPGEGADA